MATVNRPPIPNPIKRAVRQRCGFGCVLCGNPIYQYDHIIEWSIVKCHEADNLTLLCPGHHAEKTKGMLPHTDVIAANANPYCRSHGATKQQPLHYSGNSFECQIANNIFHCKDFGDSSVFSPLFLDDIPIISITARQEMLFLNYIAFDEHNNPILRIEENELVFSTRQWDVEWNGNKLTFRSALGKIFLQLNFNPPGKIEIARGRILYNEIELVLHKQGVFCLNNYHLFADNEVRMRGINELGMGGFPVGLAIGDTNVKAAMTCSGFPRGRIDHSEALRRLRRKDYVNVFGGNRFG